MTIPLSLTSTTEIATGLKPLAMTDPPPAHPELVEEFPNIPSPLMGEGQGEGETSYCLPVLFILSY